MLSTVPRELLFRTQVRVDYPHIVQRTCARELGACLRRFLTEGEDLAVVTDNTVAGLHWPAIERSLREADLPAPPLFTFAAGEASKSIETLTQLVTDMLSRGVHRRSVVLALGGGVVCDTAGFLSAIYMRGIDYINIPTSLIAQVDAAIGGKVAVNHPLCKNFIGNFHHPRAVIIDPTLLSTLPLVEIRNGLAEIVKIAMIASPVLFERLQAQSKKPIDEMLDVGQFDDIITDAVNLKIQLLLPDPFEVNLKRVLNFGHTFAHPLEIAEGFQLRHGFAVSIGMCIATMIALQRQIIKSRDADCLFSLLNAFGLPTRGPSIDPVEIWDYALPIRRIRANHFYFVVPQAIGKVIFIDDLTKDEFIRACHTLGDQPEFMPPNHANRS